MCAFYIVSTPHVRSIADDARKTDAILMLGGRRFAFVYSVLYGSWFSPAWRHCLLWANEHVQSYQTPITPSCL